METIRWIAESADALAALLLGLTAAMLGLLSQIKTDILDNCILGTLAVLSFTLLRDRWTRETADRATRDAAGRVTEALEPLRASLPAIPELRQSIDQMKVSVEGLASVQTLTGPAALEPVFRDARETTTHWTFKGGTGTYTRAMTLPVCKDIARHLNPRRGFEIRLMILDPTDLDLCARYGEYRRTFAAPTDGTGEAWTTDRTQKESFATVLAAGWHKRDYSLLNISVYLTSVMSTFRYDLSDSRIIITQDDPKFPAMVISNQSPHYHAYATELHTAQEQAPRVPIDGPHARLTEQPDQLTVERVREFFREALLPLPAHYSDADVGQIIDKAVYARNPYASPRGAGAGSTGTTGNGGTS